MMRKLSIYIILQVIGFALMGNTLQITPAQPRAQLDIRHPSGNIVFYAAEPTQVVVDPGETAAPPDRVLPPVGGNAGLVLGASVLVLIVIAGVGFASRRKAKH